MWKSYLKMELTASLPLKNWLLGLLSFLGTGRFFRGYGSFRECRLWQQKPNEGRSKSEQTDQKLCANPCVRPKNSLQGTLDVTRR